MHISQQVLTRAQVRRVDQLAIEQYGLPGVVLMENAGRGCAELLLRQLQYNPSTLKSTDTICICCGAGNNGGDGFVIARHLENHGLAVEVLLFANPEKLQGDAAINFNVLQKSGTPLSVNPDSDTLTHKLLQASWVVDALLGTGMTGIVREPLQRVIETINANAGSVLAVDLPSGLDCDTGKVLGSCIRAKLTATFVALKPALLNPAIKHLTGKIHVIDIGAPNHLLRSLDPL